MQFKYSFLAVALFFLTRAFTALYFDLGVDEAHYALYAKFLELSYFDHPPLTGWTHYIFTQIFGNSNFALRLSANILFSVLSIQIIFLLKSFKFSDRAIFWAVLALNSSFMLEALAIALLPDSLLLPIILAIIQSVKKLQSSKSIFLYILLGFLLGLAGLAKYTAILIIPAIFIYLLIQKKFIEIVFSYKTVIAILIATLVVSPVFIWNFTHNFASFTYQSDHVAGESSFRFDYFFISLGRQFLAYSPPLFIIAFYGFIKKFKSYDLSIIIGLITLLFFGLSQGLKLALPHWIAPFFALFIPIGIAVLIDAKKDKIAKYSVYFSVILTLIAQILIITKPIPFPDYKNPFVDIYGWKEASKMAAKLANENNITTLGVPNWSMASRVMYYSEMPTIVLQDKNSQFEYWSKNSDTILLVTDYFSNIPQNYCKSTTKLYEQNSTMNEKLVNSFSFFICKTN